MASRECVGRELTRIQAHWPSLKTTPEALQDYAAMLNGYDDVEVHHGVTLLLQEYDSPANPKPKHVLDAVARVTRRRRDAAVLARSQATEDAVCPLCGSRELVEVPHAGWDTRGWVARTLAAWRAWLGDLWSGPEVAPILTLPPRLEARCRPDCVRVTGSGHAR